MNPLKRKINFNIFLSYYDVLTLLEGSHFTRIQNNEVAGLYACMCIFVTIWKYTGGSIEYDDRRPQFKSKHVGSLRGRLQQLCKSP